MVQQGGHAGGLRRRQGVPQRHVDTAPPQAACHHHAAAAAQVGHRRPPPLQDLQPPPPAAPPPPTASSNRSHVRWHSRCTERRLRNKSSHVLCLRPQRRLAQHNTASACSRKGTEEAAALCSLSRCLSRQAACAAFVKPCATTLRKPHAVIGGDD